MTLTYSEGSYEIEQKEYEKGPWFFPQSAQEVKNDVEAHRYYEFHRYIGDDACQGFCERMVESVGGLFLNNRSLAIETVDFVDGDESIQKHSEEEHAAF